MEVPFRTLFFFFFPLFFFLLFKPTDFLALYKGEAGLDFLGGRKRTTGFLFSVDADVIIRRFRDFIVISSLVKFSL